MKRSEQAALKAYPKEIRNKDGFVIDIGHPQWIRDYYIEGYEQAEKDTIERIRVQIKQWMPEKDGEEHTCGERLAFNSVLHLLKEMEE